MFHMTTIADDRIRDLHQTAAELRHGRTVNPDRGSGRLWGLRLRIGATLLAAGAALVGTAHPATPSHAGR